MSHDLLKPAGLIFSFPITLILVISGLTGCSKEEHFVDFSNTELIRLFSGDSVKTWTRTRQVIDGTNQSSDDCSVKQKYIFFYNGNIMDFEIHSNPEFCDFQDSLIESGICFIKDIKSGKDAKDTLSFITGPDTINLGIISISSLHLSLKGKVRGAMIENDLEWSE